MNRVQKFKKVKSNNKNKLDTQFMLFPQSGYITVCNGKELDDALQIVEQILPFFQPDYTLTINDETWVSKSSIILNDVSYEDSYQGGFESRRQSFIPRFTTKFYLYGLLRPQVSLRLFKLTSMQIFQKYLQPENRDIQSQNQSLPMQMMTLVSMRQVLLLWMQRTLIKRWHR